MSFASHGLKRLVLMAGLVVGVAMFVGCDGSGDSGDGGGGDENGGNTATGDGGGNGGAAGGGDGGGEGGGDGGSAGGGEGNTGSGGNTGGGGNGGASGGLDHSSPRALFDSMASAAEREDFATMCHAFTPDMQGQMAMGMVSLAATAGMNPAIDAEALAPVLEKHGIAQADLPQLGPAMQDEAQALADGLDDPASFAGDMMAALPPEMSGAAQYANGAVTLTDIQIDGDTASGQLTSAGQDSGDNRVTFARIDGKWYVSP